MTNVGDLPLSAQLHRHHRRRKRPKRTPCRDGRPLRGSNEIFIRSISTGRGSRTAYTVRRRPQPVFYSEFFCNKFGPAFV
ncbi:MAG: hypothetical protein BLM47_05735 [Candidatus Reconcilbacillus cellulovorans]|uniref:Uncharacterized protein n=1 Tax=Candidatus Reconcilbacillus cellulovorans TaxID=1906605 RepID=A0A2A6E064_9BACL|nr:MAG: hypothetical protein BLM47_05735 [Candidatus Reconcilbacillus cellulovorans]